MDRMVSSGVASPVFPSTIRVRSCLKKMLYDDKGRLGLSLGFFHDRRLPLLLPFVPAEPTDPVDPGETLLCPQLSFFPAAAAPSDSYRIGTSSLSSLILDSSASAEEPSPPCESLSGKFVEVDDPMIPDSLLCTLILFSPAAQPLPPPPSGPPAPPTALVVVDAAASSADVVVVMTFIP